MEGGLPKKIVIAHSDNQVTLSQKILLSSVKIIILHQAMMKAEY